jgi:hypothetical protein
MKFSAPMRTVLLIALFAAGMVVHTTNATVMSVAMAMTDSGGQGMPDCNGCDADGDTDGSASCSFPCVPLVVGAVDADVTFQPVADARMDAGRSKGLRGRVGPPEPDPPQTTILS